MLKSSVFKKCFISLAVLFFMAFALPSSSLAASYNFTFNPPFVGSMKSTSLVEVTKKNSAYVQPSHSATPTNYFLSPAQKKQYTGNTCYL
ncbi:hypothetical protein MUB24_03840 [Lederbergia sp. NSJ-179]|uniref:hypothetical protein n=1 Tax=Lederbergia sp. NSJ-179 TaxID=2931402 RepID=UPI001FD0AFD3|nr:hypothetical protein [Lederbergia sp. NSJ-179]MCJ7840056.1 hypothetical protein [Lederbergia sp. NSJ-179]